MADTANSRRLDNAPDSQRRARKGAGGGNGAAHQSPRQAPGAPAPVPGPASSPLDDSANPPAKRGFRTVLRNRYFLRLWMAQLVSQTIQNAANYGLIILIATRTNTSYLATSFGIVAFALPAVIFGAPAGVLVDRFERRKTLWVSNILRAALCFVFSVSLFVDQKAILPAYALSFSIATISQFFAPAEGASIPLLVHPDELINALSLFNITFTIAQALGLIILGPIVLLLLPIVNIGSATHSIALQPIDSLFVIVGLLYVVCAGLVLSIPRRALQLRRPAHHGDNRQRSANRQLYSIWHGILECWQFIRRDKRLFISVLQQVIGGTVVAVVAMIAPGFVEKFFNRPPDQSILVFLPAGLGLVLGSAVTPRIVRLLRSTVTITVGFVTLSAAAVLLTVVHGIAVAVAPTLWFSAPAYLVAAILLTFCIGVALDFINVPAQTTMQEQSPDWIKGRVLAVQAMLLNAATVPFVPIMGIIADRFGILAAMDFLAAVIAVTGVTSVVFGARADRRAAMAPPRPPAGGRR